MTPTGFEHDATSTNNDSKMRNPAIKGAANSGAVVTGDPPSDPDLARLIEAWPRLPEGGRAAILAMVRSLLDKS
jgi:hypothetical protein